LRKMLETGRLNAQGSGELSRTKERGAPPQRIRPVSSRDCRTVGCHAGTSQILDKKEKLIMSKRGNNEGSIYRLPDGRWRAALTTGKNAEGKPMRKVFTAHTRHEVKDELTIALRDLQLGVLVVTDKQTIEQFLAHWLDQVVKARVRPKTLRTYSDLVKHHIAPGLGTVQLGKLTPAQVREFLNAKLESGLSPRTVKHLLVTLKGALAVAVKDGKIVRNVAALVDPPRVSRPRLQVFDQEQARAFLAAARGQRFEAAFTTAVAVGLRQGEVLGLQWSEVDLAAGVLIVRAALQRIDKRLVRVEPKTESSRRTIPLPAVCVSSLARHKADQDLQRKWAGTRWHDTGYVFTTRIGTPVDPRDLLREYYAITRPKPKEKGTPPPTLPFPPIRFHDLRHSAATLLLAQGVSARYIAELLGHTQVSFTMQTYAHVLPEVQKQVATKMDEILAPGPVATKVATKPSRSTLN
jgi:integrase